MKSISRRKFLKYALSAVALLPFAKTIKTLSAHRSKAVLTVDKDGNATLHVMTLAVDKQNNATAM